MSSNGDNVNVENSEGEKVLTMMDVLKEQEEFEEDANAVLGGSDDKNCTYPEGYIKRQAIYACMTCCEDAKEDPTKRAGVCLACSLHCHENHELIELYTKRNFRCDCGNPKFNSHPCQFTPNKTDLNEDNIYNQNFSGLYCNCHRPYPDPEIPDEEDMIQCIICEDWWHASHLDAVIPANDQYSEMICKPCMDKNEFIHDYSDFAVNVENVDVTTVETSNLSITNVTSICNDSLELAPIDKSVEVNENENNSVNDKEVINDLNKDEVCNDNETPLKTDETKNEEIKTLTEDKEVKTLTENKEIETSTENMETDTPCSVNVENDNINTDLEKNGEPECLVEKEKTDKIPTVLNESHEVLDKIESNEIEQSAKLENENLSECVSEENLLQNKSVVNGDKSDNANNVEKVIVNADQTSENNEKSDELLNENSDALSAETEISTVNESINKDPNVATLDDNEPESIAINGLSKDSKRKIPSDDLDDKCGKKQKLDKQQSCTRPKVFKKRFEGATFWPSDLRQKFCTCNSCISMYKDLSVLFLIDPEDTVTAYENLGMQFIEGAPASQYEKGLEALSTLDRVQQINAITEYNKMRDSLIDFLRNFKDRNETVKEEDIKNFFAGMKPKREPDGVYFCK